MSISGILSSNFFANTQSIQGNQQQLFQKEFQQLGTDIQSGNLSAAQSDFSTLQSGDSTATTSPNNPITQAVNQLGQDLDSGSTTAAQKDLTQLQQNLQTARQAPARHRHAHIETEGASGSSNASSSISQLLQQLGQDIQSNNLSGAQQAYNSIAQDFQLTSAGSLTSSLSSAISLSA